MWNPKTARLPYLYWLPKLHKQPIRQRFIAGSAKCTTTPLSKMLSDVLLFLQSQLRLKDDEFIQQTGVRRLFVVESFEEVTWFLSKWQSEQFSLLSSGDFSTMYTNIPHQDLKDILRSVFEEAWQIGADLVQVKSPERVQIDWTKNQSYGSNQQDRTGCCLHPNDSVSHSAGCKTQLSL